MSINSSIFLESLGVMKVYAVPGAEYYKGAGGAKELDGTVRC